MTLVVTLAIVGLMRYFAPPKTDQLTHLLGGSDSGISKANYIDLYRHYGPLSWRAEHYFTGVFHLNI